MIESCAYVRMASAMRRAACIIRQVKGKPTMNATETTTAIAANTTTETETATDPATPTAPAIDFAAIANDINNSGNRGGHARVIIRTLADNLRDSTGHEMRLLYVNGGAYTGKANDRARVRVWLRQLPEMPATDATWALGGVMAWANAKDALRAMIADADKPQNGACAYFVTIVKA